MEALNVVVNGAAIIGLVNGIGIIKPDLKSEYKWVIAVVIGAVLPYVPTDIIGPAIQGITLALASSGLFKLTQNLASR